MLPTCPQHTIASILLGSSSMQKLKPELSQDRNGNLFLILAFAISRTPSAANTLLKRSEDTEGNPFLLVC